MWSLKKSQLVRPPHSTASIKVTAEVESKLVRQAGPSGPRLLPDELLSTKRKAFFAEATMEKGENFEASITLSCILWQQGAGNRESKPLTSSKVQTDRRVRASHKSA